ncbi:MAG: TadE/TadG family type IV pilus assembly protein [Roseobacter sp.]
MQTTALPLRGRLRVFCKDQTGNVAVEAIIIVPILFWAFFATFTIFDAYRQHSINQKAAYTIGDLVSRQFEALDPTFLNGTRELFEDLARSNGQSSVRITSVWYDEANDRYVREWSRSVGSKLAAGPTEVESWNTRLPVMPNFEFITVVETWTPYAAPFDVGIIDHEIHNFIFTRPRYAPCITWEDSDCGVGT